MNSYGYNEIYGDDVDGTGVDEGQGLLDEILAEVNGKEYSHHIPTSAINQSEFSFADTDESPQGRRRINASVLRRSRDDGGVHRKVNRNISCSQEMSDSYTSALDDFETPYDDMYDNNDVYSGIGIEGKRNSFEKNSAQVLGTDRNNERNLSSPELRQSELREGQSVSMNNLDSRTTADMIPNNRSSRRQGSVDFTAMRRTRGLGNKNFSEDGEEIPTSTSDTATGPRFVDSPESSRKNTMNSTMKPATLHERGFRVDLGESDPFGKLRVLYSFVPRYLLRRLRKNPERLENITEDKFLAVVSVIDISGFTALSSRLAAQGNDGIEELKRHLNAYFGDLILKIHRYGGDIIAFAGDALIAMWVIDDKDGTASQHMYMDSMKKAAFASIQCSLTIQEELGEYDSNPAEPDREKKDILTVHIASGFGHCTGMHVGGFGGAWFWQVAGRPLEQISRIDHFSKSGQVVVSAEMWELCKIECVGKPVDDEGADKKKAASAYRVTECRKNYEILPTRSFAPNSEMEQGLVSYINPSVLHTAMKHMAERVGETRPSTVLFISCRDVMHINGLETLQKYVSVVQPATYQYDGIINKLLVDEKGTTLIVVFGLPPAGAHVDDPARACLTAITIKNQLREQKLSTSIGIATGRIFCGVYGNKDKRMEYAILGSTVNLSARLMCFTPNDILCDKVTYDRAKEVIEFETWPPISLKGISQPCPVFRPVKKLGGTGKGPQQSKNLFNKKSCVGRDNEKAAIKRAIQQLAERNRERVKVVVIKGDAGIGKSTLAYDTVKRCNEVGIKNTLCVADSFDQRPFSAFSSVLRDLFKFEHYKGESDWCQLMGQKVKESLAINLPEYSDYACVFNSILGRVHHAANKPTLFIEESEHVEQMDKSEQNKLSLWLIVELIRKSLKEEQVFVFDDAHWFDNSSWQAIQKLCGLESVLVVLCVRNGETAGIPVYEKLINLESTVVLPLAPMIDSEISKLTALLLDIPFQSAIKIPPELVDLLLQNSKGNPQFAKDLILQMHQKKLLTITSQQVTLTGEYDVSDFEMKGMEGVITSRLDMLDRQIQLTVKIASCIGKTFTIDLLLYVMQTIAGNEDVSRQQLKEYLNVIVKTLDVVYNEVDESYTFENEKLLTVAYNLLLKQHRKEIHRAIAERYEKFYAGKLDTHYPVIATHLIKDAQYAKAVTYLSMAATTALKQNRYADVVSHLESAFLIDGDHLMAKNEPQHGNWEYLLGRAYMGLGKYATASGHLQKAVNLLGGMLPKSSNFKKITGGKRFLDNKKTEKENKNVQDMDTAIKALGYKIKYPDRAKTLAAFEAQLETNPKLQRKYQICVALEALTRIHYFNGNGRAMALTAAHAVDAGLIFEISQVQLNSFSWLGFVTGAIKGKHSKEHVYHELVQRLASYNSNPDLGAVMAIHSSYLFFSGKIEDALDALNTSAMLSGTDRTHLPDALYCKEQILMLKGHIQGALAIAEEILSIKPLNDRCLVIASIIQAKACISQGNFADALQFTNLGLQKSSTISDRFILLGLRSFTKLRLKNFTAKSEFYAAFGLMEGFDQPVVPNLAEGYYFLIVTAVELSEFYLENYDKIFEQTMIRKGERILECFKNFVEKCEVGVPYYTIALGLIERAKKKYKSALHHFSTALNQATTFEFAFLEGLCYMYLYLTYSVSDQNIDKSLMDQYRNQALTFFQDNGYNFYYDLLNSSK